MSNEIISLQGVGKRYVKYEDLPLLLTRAFRFRAAHRRTHLWAVRNVDLEVAAGESVGVVGRNGSGKTTLFQMLAGVTAPTEGVVRVRGRVAPLISVGIGFHPELTGRENVYVNATILGLSKREIDKRFDSILDFAEVEAFIDTPVKFYSSGMFVRLGFSVAVASDPEVLLVDEVLAVGDVAFQLKCYDRMEEIRKNGATILVVTHNMNAVSRLCSRVLLLQNGEPQFLGETDEAISKYHDLLGNISLKGEDTPEVHIQDVELRGPTGKLTSHVKTGDEIFFKARILFEKAADNPVFALRIHKDSGQEVYSENTVTTRHRRVEAGETVDLNIRLLATLPTASYTAHVMTWTGAHEGAHRAKGKPIVFFVSGRPFVKGTNDLHASFEIPPGTRTLPAHAGSIAPSKAGARARVPRNGSNPKSARRATSAKTKAGHKRQD
jgi:ABC-2 type transport system ATP-binding protein